MSDVLTPAPSESLRREASESPPCEARAEFLLETHRVTGVLEHFSAARRLVDVMNADDGPIVVLRKASVQSLINPGEDQQRSDLLQLRREAILLAIPVRDVPLSAHRPEVVEKQSVAATLLLPGLEVAGRVYLPPEADPGTVRLIGRATFLPITDAEVAQVAPGGHRWQEPLVLVNLSRVMMYTVAVHGG